MKRALSAVFSWDWQRAIDAGKESLRRSEDEAIRDEALNIIAFAQFQLGQDESAIAALEMALEGEYTASLQANAGLVAEHMAPDRAAFHLGRLAAEAPSTDLRLAAVRRAFHVWSQSQPAWEDADQEIRIPDDLLLAIRSLAVVETSLEDHREIMRLLARFDSDWVAEPSNTASSPHGQTWDHQLYVARASHDPNAYIQALASALRDSPETSWLMKERDDFVAGMRGLIFDDIENVAPAAYAYEAIEAGLPMEPFDQVTLTCGAVISICRSLTADKNEPSDNVYFHFLKATEAATKLDEEQRETVDPILRMAGNSYAASVAVSRNAMLEQGFEALNSLGAELFGVSKHRINWTAVAESLRPLHRMTDDSLQALDRAKKHASESEIQEGIQALSGEFRRLRGFAANPRSAF